MRRILLSLAVAASAAGMWVVATPAAHADLHGCISISGAAHTGSDAAAGTVMPGTCTFVMVAGDTYTGVGTFSITGPGCGPVAAGGAQTPLTCSVGATVTVDTAPGGFVAAGSLT
jgi:hypothetical protein